MFVFRLDTPHEYLDSYGETASNWKKYTLTPGVYPVEFTTIDGRPVPVGDRPYYARIVVPAVLTETYYVNRIFQYSSLDHITGLNEATTRTFRPYAYQIEAGYRLCGGIIENAGTTTHHEEQS